MTQELGFAVLGSLRATVDGRPVQLGGPKQRSVLAMLLLAPNRVVSVERLIDGVWGDEPHDKAASTLQVYVSNLRKLLGAGRLLTERPGYRVVVGPEELDLLLFEAAIASAERHDRAGRHVEAAAAYREALAIWQGEALADLVGEPFAAAAVVGLNERREIVRELAFDAELAGGRHHELIPELEAAVAGEPLREHRWAQLMLALYRSGRQADALAAYSTARGHLVDELGIEPGPELRDLESAILMQGPALDWRKDADRPAAADLSATTVRRAADGAAAFLSLPNGSRVELGPGTWVIGRHSDCEVVLASPGVSRRHAELRHVEGGWVISDLGSTNGVEVNGERVTEFQLSDGDRILLGHYELVFTAPPPVA